jgi:hypothetical protein
MDGPHYLGTKLADQPHCMVGECGRLSDFPFASLGRFERARGFILFMTISLVRCRRERMR